MVVVDGHTGGGQITKTKETGLEPARRGWSVNTLLWGGVLFLKPAGPLKTNTGV